MTSIQKPRSLRSAFGSLSQNQPAPSARTADIPRAGDEMFTPSELPAAPVFHKSGVVLVPSRRIDGSSLDAPWNLPEPFLCDWLRSTPIEHVDEMLLDGVGGSFWVWCRSDDVLRGALLRFDTVGADALYAAWGTEYGLSAENHDLLRRGQAAYEIAKAAGCEDLTPPLAAREVNLVPLISDAVRDKVASSRGIAPILVDETFGTVALLQLAPIDAINFVEHWATLGADSANRFQIASDALRHSLYRVIALDFILGVGNRSLADFLFNRSTGCICAYSFGVSLPDPLAVADRYIEQRAIGWDRKLPSPMTVPADGMPAAGADSMWIGKEMGEKEIGECLQTFAQMSKAMSPEVVALACQAVIELGVPPNHVAGMLCRISFLQESPEIVISKPYDYVRNILVPMRRGFPFEGGRNAKIVSVVNQLMQMATGEAYDFAAAMQA